MKSNRFLLLSVVVFFVVFFIWGKGISQSTGIFQFVSKSDLSITQIEKFELISNKPFVGSLRSFRINEIKQKFNEKILMINLNNQVSFSAIQTDTKSCNNDELSWIGKPEKAENTGEYVILEYTQQGLTGIIWFENILYSIAPISPDIFVLYQVDQSKFPPDHPDDFLLNKKDKSNSLTSYPSSQILNTESTSTYDILVAYTLLALDEAGDINGLINTAVNQTNQIYGNSQTTPRANLVHKMYVNYTEVDMVTDLSRLIDTNDGFMDNVHNYRDQYGADVVILILGSGEYCGLAGALEAEDWNAFAVVKWDCATQRYSFTHEIGHLFGSEHDVGYDNNRYEPYPYNHGFNHYGPTFQTIMAIKGEQTIDRIPYLSTPSVYGYYNGNYYTIGSSQWENNARIHSERDNVVSNFRSPQLTLEISGPTYLNPNQFGTFSANPANGSGTYINYRWWERNDEDGGPAFADGGGIILAPPPGYWIEQYGWEGQQTIQIARRWDFSLKCEVTDSDNSTATDIHSVIVGGGLAKSQGEAEEISIVAIPEEVELTGNYPNPFNPSTTIKFGLPEDSNIKLTVYSVTGQKIIILVDGVYSIGYHEVKWDGKNQFGDFVSNGIYIYELKAGSSRRIKKMVFAK